MVGDLHGAVLLDPQFAHDDVVYATVDVTPRVRLVVPASDVTSRQSHYQTGKQTSHTYINTSCMTYRGSC